ncbi:MAG: helix-hairpin-helix domain-containing protein [Bacteroidales bacterium]|nr:helix-hairpin-helix domain-containing protein [Bacteroidales bacterium]
MKGRTEEENPKKTTLRNSARISIISFVFLVVGYQSAVVVTNAAQSKVIERREKPDTVYVYPEQERVERKVASSTPKPRLTQPQGPVKKRRKVESFRFNPNEVSLEDLQRLGFSEKQATSIDNYRRKGGRFRRKEDFARSYVVSDSVYARLEPYIDIPKIDINKADSAAFETLPGIGKWFASKMVSYREELGGYSCKEQLMDIWHFDQEKYDGLKDIITISDPKVLRLWTMPEDSLKMHPHVRYAAHGIVLFRQNNPKEKWTLEELKKAGVLKPEYADRLSKCRIEQPICSEGTSPRSL